MRPTCAPHYFRIVAQEEKRDGAKNPRRSLSFATGVQKGLPCRPEHLPHRLFRKSQTLFVFSLVSGQCPGNPFEELWFNSQTLKRLRDISSYKGKCGACEYVSVCGGCRARADAVHDDFLAEEPFCLYTPDNWKTVLEHDEKDGFPARSLWKKRQGDRHE